MNSYIHSIQNRTAYFGKQADTDTDIQASPSSKYKLPYLTTRSKRRGEGPFLRSTKNQVVRRSQQYPNETFAHVVVSNGEGLNNYIPSTQTGEYYYWGSVIEQLIPVQNGVTITLYQNGKATPWPPQQPCPLTIPKNKVETPQSTGRFSKFDLVIF